MWLTVIAAGCLAIAPLWPTEVEAGHDGKHFEIEIAAIIASLMFLMALAIELTLLNRRPERDWYEGRAVAESAKTLTWRYAVGGDPYPIGRSDADESFTRDVHALGTDIDSLQATVASGGRVTAWMELTRGRPLEERREVYLRHRVRDQEEWYTRKAAYNRVRAAGWSRALLVGEALGVVFALLKGFAIISIDLASVAAAVIASGAAWLAVKQHESIATAYSLASSELAAIHIRMLGVDVETQWAVGVASAEEAISREHTMWRASRSKPEAPLGPTGRSS